MVITTETEHLRFTASHTKKGAVLRKELVFYFDKNSFLQLILRAIKAKIECEKSQD